MTQRDFIVSVELGSHTLRGLSGRIAGHAPEGFEIIGWAEVPSAGIRRGIVIDVGEAARGLERLVGELEAQMGAKIRGALIAVSGAHLAAATTKALVAVARPDGEIGDEDVRRVEESARASAIGANRGVLHTLAHEYFVDGEGGVLDPRGMRGMRLELSALIISAAAEQLRMLEEVFERAGIDIEAMVAAPLAAAYGAMSQRQRELGAMVLDIGGGTTDFAVFEEGRCLHAGVIPLGGSHITNDLAIGMRTSVEVAEQAKHTFGTATTQNLGRERIELPEDIPQGEPFPRRQLVEIIEARLEELLELAENELKQIGRVRLLPGGVILTGGTANLPKITELARKHLKLPAAVGTPQVSTLPTGMAGNPAFTTPIGVLFMAMQERDIRKGSRLSLPGFSSLPQGMSGRIKKLFGSILP